MSSGSRSGATRVPDERERERERESKQRRTTSVGTSLSAAARICPATTVRRTRYTIIIRQQGFVCWRAAFLSSKGEGETREEEKRREKKEDAIQLLLIIHASCLHGYHGCLCVCAFPLLPSSHFSLPLSSFSLFPHSVRRSLDLTFPGTHCQGSERERVCA